MSECPKCGAQLLCLGGESAHPDNWYCIDDACGYKAWEVRGTGVKVEVKTYTEAEHTELMQALKDDIAALQMRRIGDVIMLNLKHEQELEAQRELLQLIYKDLKMRADCDGVVDISNFIWDRLNKHLSASIERSE